MKYKVFHLSHTDLDGYGAQSVSGHYFKNIQYYNSNYGKEINDRFFQILQDVQSSQYDKNVILITDLNLSLKQCETFEHLANESSKDIKLLLLDHHQSGIECANKYKWYLLDSSRCATKITYDFFSSIYGKDKALSFFVNVVNSVDIWLENDELFEIGKVCLGLVANAKEINRIMFDSENNNYIAFLLQRAQNYFHKENPQIELEDAIHFIKKRYFKKTKDDTLNNLISSHMVELLSNNKEKMTLKYKNSKGILTYNIGNVSVIGNDFLKHNPDFEFFMDVTSRKTISLRSNSDFDVSKMSKELFSGGGHQRASGGAFPKFKDSFLYNNILNQVQNYIDEKA